MNNLLTNDYFDVLSGSPATKMKLSLLIESIITLTNVIEDSGVPAISGSKHQWYFDTAASKYYRNTDGGTTWVALN